MRSRQFNPKAGTAEIEAAWKEIAVPKLEAAVFGSNDGNVGKKNMGALKASGSRPRPRNCPTLKPGEFDAFYEHKIDEYIHEEAINNNRRADGRAMDEIRPL